MTKKSANYRVFFDTMGLRGEQFITDGLHDSMQVVKKNKLVNIKYLLPEIVKDEWVNNYCKRAQAQYLKIENAENAFKEMKVSGHTFNLPDESDVVAMGEKYLKNMGFEVIKTPYANIDIPGLIQRAVNHKLPFSEDGDKGIKDALIGLTIKEFLETASSEHKYILITRDGTFLDYIKEIIPTSKQLRIFSSMNQLQSHIELELNDLSQELAADARKLLFENENENSLWYTETLGRRLTAYYDKQFTSAEDAIKYINHIKNGSLYTPIIKSLFPQNTSYTIDKLVMKLNDPVFEFRRRQTLHWSTTLIFKKDYLIERTSASNAGFLNIDQTERLTHNVVFEIKWKTKLNSELELENPQLESIKPIDENKTNAMLLNNTYSPNTNLVPGPTGLSTLTGLITGKNSYSSKLAESIATLNSNMQQTGVINSVNEVSNALKKLTSSSELSQKHFWEDDSTVV